MFTVYDPDKDCFTKVEEPDPSLHYTYADYLKWNFEERLELIKGRIFKMSPAPSPFHQLIITNILTSFHTFLRKKPCKVYPAPFDVRLPRKNKEKDDEISTVVQPDLSIVCDESKIDHKGCCGAPDIIVEVLSPGNSRREVDLKFKLYEEAGVKEYWIVNPAEENLIVFILNKEGKYPGGKMYAGNNTIFCDAVPGLAISTEDIFLK